MTVKRANQNPLTKVQKSSVRPLNPQVTIPTGDGALLRYLEATGRTPPVTLSIYTLENLRREIFIDKFISYRFQSSILVPVDTFECEFYFENFWMNGDGKLIIGKPNMYAVGTGRRGTLFLLRASRQANVLTMRSTRNSTSIPNMILPIWNGQETVQTRISPEQFLKNSTPGAARLLKLGHRTPKAVVVSTPQGNSPQDLSSINALTVGQQNAGKQQNQLAGNSKLLQSYAKREMARANLRDLMIQACVPGHCNDLAEPFQVDSVYRVKYDIDDVNEDMFLYEVEYSLTENDGARTRLFLCRQTAIVSNVRAL
jgi:hypothetical protein